MWNLIRSDSKNAPLVLDLGQAVKKVNSIKPKFMSTFKQRFSAITSRPFSAKKHKWACQDLLRIPLVGRFKNTTSQWHCRGLCWSGIDIDWPMLATPKLPCPPENHKAEASWRLRNPTVGYLHHGKLIAATILLQLATNCDVLYLDGTTDWTWLNYLEWMKYCRCCIIMWARGCDVFHSNHLLTHR